MGTTRRSSTETIAEPSPARTVRVAGAPFVEKRTGTRWKYVPTFSSEAVALGAVEAPIDVTASPLRPPW